MEVLGISDYMELGAAGTVGVTSIRMIRIFKDTHSTSGKSPLYTSV